MKRIKSLVAVVLTAGLIGCQSAPVHLTNAPVSSASVAVAEPSSRSRTVLVVVLLAALVAAALVIGASSGGDDIY
jgi:hypothetical protein